MHTVFEKESYEVTSEQQSFLMAKEKLLAMNLLSQIDKKTSQIFALQLEKLKSAWDFYQFSLSESHNYVYEQILYPCATTTSLLSISSLMGYFLGSNAIFLGTSGIVCGVVGATSLFFAGRATCRRPWLTVQAEKRLIKLEKCIDLIKFFTKLQTEWEELVENPMSLEKNKIVSIIKTAKELEGIFTNYQFKSLVEYKFNQLLFIKDIIRVIEKNHSSNDTLVKSWRALTADQFAEIDAHEIIKPCIELKYQFLAKDVHQYFKLIKDYKEDELQINKIFKMSELGLDEILEDLNQYAIR